MRNALKAEPKSVRLSSLVGSGGLWYGFGKAVMDMCVAFCPIVLDTEQNMIRLDDDQAEEMSDVMTKVRQTY